MGEAVVILLTRAALAGCGAPTTTADVDHAVGEVEAAWEALDGDRLAASDDALTSAVLCIADPLDALRVAATFRAHAYALFVAGREGEAADALRAARRVQPGYTLPTMLAGPNHPLRALWDAAGGDPEQPPVPLPPPALGALRVDGTVATVAPADRPYVFQHLDSGTVLATALQATGTLPTYELLPAPPGPEDRHRSRRMVVTGAIVGGSGLALVAAAGGTRLAYQRAPPEDGPLDGLRYANYGLGAGGLALSATGLGLGVAALWVGDW